MAKAALQSGFFRFYISPVQTTSPDLFQVYFCTLRFDPRQFADYFLVESGRAAFAESATVAFVESAMAFLAESTATVLPESIGVELAGAFEAGSQAVKEIAIANVARPVLIEFFILVKF